MAPALAAQRQLDATVRAEYGRVLSVLLTELRDFDLAEDALGDALADAAEQWQKSGVPDNPGAWLLTVARRRGVDRLRRQEVARRRAPLLVVHDAPPVALPDPDVIPDERLRLLCVACHPALSPESRVALTLRVVVGLRTAEVARAFLVSDAAMQQRITRAKRKIQDAGIPYTVPPRDQLPARLAAILRVVYLIYNEGHTASSGPAVDRVDLQEEAIRLAELIVDLLPDHTEAQGLLALLLLTAARRPARVAGGRPVPLPEQDRSRWDRSRLVRGVELVRSSMTRGIAGPYLLQAAIASVHAEAVSYDTTDWRRILAFYDLLVEVNDTPVVRLNRAVAMMEALGPSAAIEEVDALQTSLGGYYPWYVTRAEILVRLGRTGDAVVALERAIELCDNRPVVTYLGRRIKEVSSPDGPQSWTPTA